MLSSLTWPQDPAFWEKLAEGKIFSAETLATLLWLSGGSFLCWLYYFSICWQYDG